MGLLKMDLRRSIWTVRFLLCTIGVAAVIFLSSWDLIASNMRTSVDIRKNGSIDMLIYSMMMDKYKVIMVLFLSGIYTAGYCYDVRKRYIRAILNRTDLFTYSISKFASNTIAILLSSLISFYLFTGIVMAFQTPIKLKGIVPCYYQMAWDHPVLFTGWAAIQFGLVCAACSAVGILFSAYQEDVFVIIGISGMVFFCAVSFIPTGTIFDVYNLISMLPTLPGANETRESTMALWGILYPMLVVTICASLYYRRMKWRVRNGLL